MSIPDKLPHAAHNEETCKYLFESGLHFDWVVTTAFYSALHYVQSKMFPLTDNSPITGKVKIYPCFPEYYIEFKPTLSLSKHEATAALVTTNIPTVADQYYSLMDKCMTARYNDYNVQQAEAAMCMRKLQRIKEACLPPKVEVKK